MIIHGDCLEVLDALPDHSLDACVTDPPYHLTSSKKAAAGFMGQEWDGGDIAFRPETWRAVFRVLKPGAHLLAFSGSRTYHRMACAIEDAGFEIRDQLDWIYGSGFPKSLDVSKAIDKLRDDTPEIRVVCRWLRARMESAGVKSSEIAERFGFHSRMVDHWAARDTDSQPSLPTMDQWENLREVLGFNDDEIRSEVVRLNHRKGTLSEDWYRREVTGEGSDGWKTWGTAWGFEGREGTTERRDNPATEDAARWEGWGTALKPAHEPIVLARVPLEESSIARQVLATGTGAMNLGACRVGNEGAGWNGLTSAVADPTSYHMRGTEKGRAAKVGRHPPNILLGHPCDEGETCHPGCPVDELGDKAKFFPVFRYQAKPSKAEREAGLDDLDSGTLNRTNPGGLENDPRWAPRTRKNVHPTVKPVELIQWLVRLVTPPGGAVLDPFVGSGTTGAAAALEGRRFVGVELLPRIGEDEDQDFVAIARARFAHWKGQAGEG